MELRAERLRFGPVRLLAAHRRQPMMMAARAAITEQPNKVERPEGNP